MQKRNWDSSFMIMFSYFFQLDDTKRLADAEQRDRATLLGKFRNLVRKGNAQFPKPKSGKK